MWLIVLLLLLGIPVAYVVNTHTKLRRLRSEVDALRGDLDHLLGELALDPSRASRIAARPPAPVPVDLPAAPTLSEPWSEAAEPAVHSAPDGSRVRPPPPAPADRPAPAQAHAPARATVSRRQHAPPRLLPLTPQKAVQHGPTSPDVDDLEIRLGTTWTLRIGLVAIAVAAALFARTIVPDLPPAAKVALAYAGAWLLFGAGKVFEARLERFARPVMASGLALAFFVSFAAHFVPAMRAVPLAASLIWMAAGTATVLAFATRWGSQPTAGLAIFLGHVTAYVAAGDAGSASLVAIAFLAVTAVVLLLRNDWLPLSLFAIMAANGTHLLWALAAHGAVPRPTFMALNLIFLSSYYLIFLTADLLWWRRRGAAILVHGSTHLGRAFGPANLVVFVATASWLLAQGSATPAMTSAFFFAMAALQGGVAVAVRRFGSPDDAVYVAAGTALLTIGLFARFDALALDLLLAALALVLLVTAHVVRRRVFHGLAQAALATSILQVWRGAVPPDGGTAVLLGGVAIAAAYLVMSQLEAVWYGGDPLPWGEPRPALRTLQEDWDTLFRGVAPALSVVHALAGALVLLRTIDAHVQPDAAAGAASAALIVLTAVAIALRSLPLTLAWLAVHAGFVYFATVAAPAAGSGPILAVVGAGLPLLLAHRSVRAAAPFATAGPWIAQLGVWLAAAAMLPLASASAGGAATSATYLIWIALVGLLFAFAALTGAGAFDAPGAPDWNLLRTIAAPVTAGAGALLVLFVTHQFIGHEAAAPAWASGWGALLAAGAWRFRSRALDAGSVLLVVATVPVFHLGLGLGPAVAGSLGASAAVIGVPLLLALAWDHRVPATMMESSLSAVPYVLYALAGLTWGYVVLERADGPWFGAWAMLLPVGLLLAARRGELPRATGVALALTFGAALLQLAALADRGAVATVWATACTVAAVVAVERLAAQRVAASRGGSGWLALALVATAAALALMAVLAAAEFGATWRTAGWSIAAATILALGFAWRSAAYRRIGLAAFALSLGRVFIVDVRSLPTGAQTLAFLALGVSLVAVAWLYARFAGEIKRWL